jgi:hypothetical protein
MPKRRRSVETNVNIQSPTVSKRARVMSPQSTVTLTPSTPSQLNFEDVARRRLSDGTHFKRNKDGEKFLSWIRSNHEYCVGEDGEIGIPLDGEKEIVKEYFDTKLMRKNGKPYCHSVLQSVGIVICTINYWCQLIFFSG